VTQFQHTLAALLRGKKTETSRIIRSGERLEDFYYDGPNQHVYAANDRLVWATNGSLFDQTYAIQPRRGQKSIGRFKVEKIWRQDVRTLTVEQLQAEGMPILGGWYHFVQLWAKMHDKAFEFNFDPSAVDYRVREGKRRDIVGWDTLKEMIANRPAERYQAWRLKIRVLNETVDWDSPAVVRALQTTQSTVY
jgi:hypothetical protein